MLTSIMRGKQFLRTNQGIALLAIVVGAIALRIPLMLFHGYYSDLATYVQWGDSVVQHLATLYTTTTGGGFGNRGGGGFGFGGQSVNYPPGMPYLFGGIVWIFDTMLAPLWHASLATLIRSDGIGPFFAKVPILLADVGVVILLYREALRRHSARFALIVAAAYAFSPAVLYDGAIWGQTDGLASFPLLIALFAVLDERYVLGGVSLAVAILLKPQPLIFVPLILLYLWRWQSRQNFARFAGAGLITAVLGLLPIMIPTMQVFAMISNIQTESYNATSSLTSDAFNFWWLAGYGHQTLGSSLFGLHSGIIGDILFGGVTLIVCGQIWRHREPITLGFGMAIQIFGFFLFMGGQHERYLFMLIPLLLACIVLVPRQEARPLVALYVAGTVLCLLNMVIGVGGGSFGSSQMIPFLTLQPLSDFLSTSFDTLGMLIAFMICGTFVYAFVLFVNWQRQPGEADAPSAALAETA